MPHISKVAGLFVQIPLPGEYPMHVFSGGRCVPVDDTPELKGAAYSGWTWRCVHHDSEIVGDE